MLQAPLFVEDTSSDLASFVKRASAFGMGGWWLGGTHMMPNPNFMAEVEVGGQGGLACCWRHTCIRWDGTGWDGGHGSGLREPACEQLQRRPGVQGLSQCKILCCGAERLLLLGARGALA